MSIANLFTAIQQKLVISLKDQINNPEHNIRFCTSGRPIATAGHRFVAIHLLQWTNPESGNFRILKDEVGIGITISIKARSTPHDREAPSILLESTIGLAAIADTIRESLHGNGSLASSAGRNESLRWVSAVGPTERYSDWYSPKNESDLNTSPVGYSMELLFVGAARMIGIGC